MLHIGLLSFCAMLPRTYASLHFLSTCILTSKLIIRLTETIIAVNQFLVLKSMQAMSCAVKSMGLFSW